MAISIVICTRDRVSELERTLRSVCNTDGRAGVLAEIILVDNSSNDSAIDVVNRARKDCKLPVRLLSERVVGQTRARNSGICSAKGDVLLWTDDDVRVPRDWVERMARPLLDGSADAVAGGIRLAPSLERDWMTPRHRAWMAAFDEASFNKKPAMIGANMGFRRDVLEKVPAFDTELGPGALGFMDETLFTAQLLHAGCRLQFVPGAEVEHHFDPSRLLRDSLLKATRRYGRSNAYLSHHWYHDSVTWPSARIAKIRALLAMERLRTGRPPSEGMTEQEMGLRCHMHFCREMKHLHGTRRNYDKYGLRKLEQAVGDPRS